MRLAQTGELKLLKRVRERFSSGPYAERVIVGIGDDAAVIAPASGKIVVTTDMMNEGVHFDLSCTSPFQLGYKLVAVNVSDVMAMGCVPKFLFLDLAFTANADEEFFDSIYDGIEASLGIYGVSLLGGDLCSSRNDVILAATVIGEGDRIVLRKGAVPGDKIYMTSSTGDSACGLEILKRLDAEGKKRIRNLAPGDVSQKPEEALKIKTGKGEVLISWEMARPLILRHLMPVARDTGDIAKYASSMMDISDGLFIDLTRLCGESGTGAVIRLDRLPVSAGLEGASRLMGLDPMQLACSGGEDYEILFTAPDFPCEAYNTSHDIKVTCIGEVSDKGMTVIDREGIKVPLEAKGYEHFGPS